MAEKDAREKRKTVKVLVWDLDNTLWKGVLLEGDPVEPIPEAVAALEVLDQRGVLHSIASRNDHGDAMAKLREFGLDDYFLCPRIGWQDKSGSVRAIAEELNIGLDAFAFIDDQPFERDEVAFALSQVRCYDAADVAALPDLAEFTPRFVTDESRQRRRLYQADALRKQDESEFGGPQEEFLASLRMRMVIAPARRQDLQRAEELTVRTNQLNTTGYTYSYAELEAMTGSERHLLLTATLEDRYGPYGTIGLALVEKGESGWVVRLLLMSCRVMSRGVGSVLINHVRRLARDAGAALTAEFVKTGRNRMMYAAYKFNGFAESRRDGDFVLFEADTADVPDDPPYLTVTTARA